MNDDIIKDSHEDTLSSNSTSILDEQIKKTDKVSSLHVRLKNDLYTQRDSYAIAAANHKAHEKFFNQLYLAVGYIQSIVLVIVTALSGINHVDNGDTNTTARWIFGLSLAVTILSVTITWFKFPEKISGHHAASGQYSDIYTELRVFLLKNNTAVDLNHMEALLVEKERLINIYKPNFTKPCFVTRIYSTENIP